MKDKRFPLIAEGIFATPVNKLTVCFTEENKGVVVESNDYSEPVGHCSDNWKSCFIKEQWRIIAQPSEYPKIMNVSRNDTESVRYATTTKVLGYFENLGYLSESGEFWQDAVDIPEQSNENQEILLKIEELQEQLNELKSKL